MCDSKNKEQELWRLRLNWAFIIFMAPMYSISLYGITSSFHQFVTNPTEVEILSQNNTKQKVSINYSFMNEMNHNVMLVKQLCTFFSISV